MELVPGVPEHGDSFLHQGDPLGRYGGSVEDGVLYGHWHFKLES